MVIMPVGFVAIEAKEEDTGCKMVDMGIEKSSEHDMRFLLHDIGASNKTGLMLTILAAKATPLVWIYACRVRCLESLGGGA